jgi:thiamine biosynthesis protein ThiI
MEHAERKRIVVRYNEIFLKGNNRAFFEKALCHNVKMCLKRHSVPYEKVNRYHGKIIVFTKEDSAESCRCLSKVFGISSFSPAIEFNSREEGILEKLKESAYALLLEKGIDSAKTFRIAAKRSDKRFPIESTKINEEIGGFIQEKTGAAVKMQAPDLYVGIEIIMEGLIHMFTEKIDGPNGLPTSTEGKVISLMSGGIDSAASAWLMMKRGCRVVMLFLDQSPYSDETNINRVKKIAGNLSEFYYGDRLKLYIVKSGENLTEFRKRNDRYTCVFCKRSMLRFASKIAEIEHADAICDGSSLAQVASQTISNMAVENEATKYPVLRPLVGFDKNEIIELAKKIGTYDISISKVLSCTALPPHPATKSTLEKLKEIEQTFDFNTLIEKAVSDRMLFLYPEKEDEPGKNEQE